MQRLKVGLEASFAGSRLTRGRAAGWAAVILFVNSRSARYEYHTHEKSVRFARRGAVSFAELGKTPSFPGGWAVWRCLAS
jgi:hypothetical protein